MRIITLETLKTMPNGTVFSKIDKYGNLEGGIRILTGKFENRDGFNGEMTLYPRLASNENGERDIFEMFENGELIKIKIFLRNGLRTIHHLLTMKKINYLRYFQKPRLQK